VGSPIIEKCSGVSNFETLPENLKVGINISYCSCFGDKASEFPFPKLGSRQQTKRFKAYFVHYVPPGLTFNKSTCVFCMIYDIYCNWVSTWWQWSVNLYTKSEETAIYKRRNNTQSITKTIHKIDNKHTRQENKQRIFNNLSRVIRK